VCNVEWVEDPHEPKPATTYASGNALAIVRAVVRIQRPADLFGARPAAILHEGGHVLGLAHSDRRSDVMHPEVVDADFSRDELAVLAWIYGRGR
jgi:matrixin